MTENIPQKGDRVYVEATKNFKAGTYEIIAGGDNFEDYGVQRRQLKKQMQGMTPPGGHRLFVSNLWSGGNYHFIIAVPEESVH